jgi:hypothetical protein
MRTRTAALPILDAVAEKAFGTSRKEGLQQAFREAHRIWMVGDICRRRTALSDDVLFTAEGRPYSESTIKRYFPTAKIIAANRGSPSKNISPFEIRNAPFASSNESFRRNYRSFTQRNDRYRSNIVSSSANMRSIAARTRSFFGNSPSFRKMNDCCRVEAAACLPEVLRHQPRPCGADGSVRPSGRSRPRTHGLRRRRLCNRRAQSANRRIRILRLCLLQAGRMMHR